MQHPIPYLTRDTRLALDHEAADLLGFTFTALVLHCRSTGWRPTGQRRLALRVAVEVALAQKPTDVSELEDAAAPTVGGTLAEQVVQLVGGALYLAPMRPSTPPNGSGEGIERRFPKP